MRLFRVRLCQLASVLLVLCTLSSVASAHADSTLVDILTNNQTATPIPKTGDLEITYEFSGFGLRGSASREINLSTGAYVESTSAGPVTLGSGFDGSTPWMRDFSGAYTQERGGDRVQFAVNQAYRLANRWWQPHFAGADIRFSGVDTIADAPAQHLSVVPHGGKRFDAWFDVRSHLLVQIRETQGFMLTQTNYTNYTLVQGIMLPGKTVVDLGTGPAGTFSLTLIDAKRRSRPLQSRFTCPNQEPEDATIDAGSALSALTFRLLNNHIYVPVMVNSKGPYTFILDTGGHLALSPKLAAELGTDAQGKAPESGAGEQLASTAFAHVDQISLGGVHLHNQTAFVTNVYDEAVEGIPVDGMIGFELFRRFVVQIDYSTQHLTIFDPSRFSPTGAGSAMPVQFYDHLPEVAGRLDNVAATFDIDTGSRGELDVTSPFAKRHELNERYPHAVSTVTGWGVGGPVSSRTVRLPSIQLGPVFIDKPTADLSDASYGSISDSNYDGNVGSALLKRFVATFDYRHQRLYLKAAQRVGPDIGTSDKSGMWINAAATGFVITAIVQQGPAAEAGLKQGDVIERIDGKTFLAADLSDIRERLRVLPEGTKVHLQVMRDMSNQAFEVTLRNLVAEAHD